MTFKDYYYLTESPYSVFIPRPVERQFIDPSGKENFSPTINPKDNKNMFDFYAEMASEGTPYRKLYDWTIMGIIPTSFIPFWDKEQNIIFMFLPQTGKSRPINGKDKNEVSFANQMKDCIARGCNRDHNTVEENLIKSAKLHIT